MLDTMENDVARGAGNSEDARILDDEALDTAIEARRQTVGEYERAFVEARQRFDSERRALRTLEEERTQRQARAAGLPASTEQVPKPKRKRSTTGMDAVLGRDGIDPASPFEKFVLMSLQRQEIVLNATGARNAQVLAFVDKVSKGLLEAQTFGEARMFLEQGHTLGRPGVPLQRQAVWYTEQGKSGWLRLDQIFVEQRVEGA
jgi:hypothetical protein